MVYAIVLAVLLLVVAMVVRAGLASLARTPRADALHDAPDHRGAGTAASLLENRSGLQPSIGIVHMTLLVAASLAAAFALATSNLSPVALAVAFLLVGLVAVLLGDAIPRSYGRARPRELAYRLAWLLKRVQSIGAFGNDLLAENEELDGGHDVDDHKEIDLISSVLEFSDTIVREVMVPRPDMITISFESTSAHALEVVIDHGFSRIPVTGSDIDDIKGIVYAKDLLRVIDEAAGSVPVADIMRSASFVPETKRVSDLLRDMQTNQTHMALVVDEFGGTAGIVTIEDLLEELVGEIADEYDREDPMVITGIDGSLLVDGRLDVDELGSLVNADLPAEDWDTVGGLVLGLAGRVPREGESFDVGPITITTVRVQGRRVAKVRVSHHGSVPVADTEAS